MPTPRSDDAAEPTLLAAEREGAVDLGVSVGVVVATAPDSDPADLRAVGRRMARDAVDELASATDVTTCDARAVHRFWSSERRSGAAVGTESDCGAGD